MPHSPAGKARHSLIVRYLSRGDVAESRRRCGPSRGADVGRCGQMGALCELRDLVRSQRNVEEFDLRRLS